MVSFNENPCIYFTASLCSACCTQVLGEGRIFGRYLRHFWDYEIKVLLQILKNYKVTTKKCQNRKVLKIYNYLLIRYLIKENKKKH